MKRIYLFIAVLFAINVNAQNIDFPDSSFKAKLLLSAPSNDIGQGISQNNLKIDTNGDGEISLTEAQNIYFLNIGSAGITDLEGIQHFVNLKSLLCSGNLFTNINAVAQLTHLQTLLCEGGNVTELNVSGMTTLQTLYCGNNPFTTLDLFELPNLITLNCSNSDLQSLDASHLTSLYALYIYSNPQLTYVNIKNGSIESPEAVNFDGSNNIQYMCTDDSQVVAMKNRLALFGNTSCVVNSYCSFTPGGVFYTIQGENRIDIDGNGCNTSDLFYPNLKMNLSNSSQAGTYISNAAGNYMIPVTAGTHTVTPVLENPSYFTVSPTSMVVWFPAQPSPKNQNFCITPNGIHPDVDITIIPLLPARPGFDVKYKVICRNKGNVSVSGNIQVSFNDGVLDFVSATPAVSMQTSGNLSWDFTNLQPFQTKEVVYLFNVNSPLEVPAVDINDVLDYIATAAITGQQDNLSNDNTFQFSHVVVGSLDPNDKTCLQGTKIPPSMTGKYVNYVIRFENKGNYLAENVVVKDIIDTTKFDITTLTTLSSSHPFTTHIENDKVEFIFEGINLPYQNDYNDGYVAFKIRTLPTLAIGNSFSNTASIYFDYNSPVITNTATTTIALLGVKDFEFSDYFSIYPNPANDVLNIESKNNIEITSINIYNTLGQLIVDVVHAKDVSKVDVSNLQAGNYFIRINSDKGTTNAKFVKN